MQNIPNVHLIEIKYLGATNNHSSRTKLTSQRFNDSVTAPYNHKYNSSLDQGIDYLTNVGYTILGKGESKDGYFVVVQEFRGLKESK